MVRDESFVFNNIGLFYFLSVTCKKARAASAQTYRE